MDNKDIFEHPENVKLAIVDDHQLFADGLKNLLELKGGFRNCLVYNSSNDAMQKIPQEKPHLSIIDINLPDYDGVELTKKLLSKDPSLKIIMLTIDDSRETVFRAITSGAYGYLLKNAPFMSILRDINAALQGDIVIGMEVAPLIMNELRSLYTKGKKITSPQLKVLSNRELEVLKEVAQGKNNNSIAETLFISEKTVKNHITNILGKLEIEDRMKLIVFAIKEGFLEE